MHVISPHGHLTPHNTCANCAYSLHHARGNFAKECKNILTYFKRPKWPPLREQECKINITKYRTWKNLLSKPLTVWTCIHWNFRIQNISKAPNDNGNGLSLSMTRVIGIMVLMVVAYYTAHSFSPIYCNPFRALWLRSHLCSPWLTRWVDVVVVISFNSSLRFFSSSKNNPRSLYSLCCAVAQSLVWRGSGISRLFDKK